MREESASDDEVLWAMKFEKEQLTGRKSFELLIASRLPEIYLVNVP